MEILSRGELIDLIENNNIETKLIFKNEYKTTNESIIINKRNQLFYKIIWGEIIDDNGVVLIWFNKKANRVHLHESGNWMTNKEIRELNSKYTPNILLDLPLPNVDVFFSSGKQYDEDILIRAGSSVAEQKQVLIASTKTNVILPMEIEKMISKQQGNAQVNADLIERDLDKKEALYLTEKHLNMFEGRYFKDEISLMKHMILMKSVSGLDLVIVDGLLLDPDDKYNVNKNISLHYFLDNLATELECKIITNVEVIKGDRNDF